MDIATELKKAIETRAKTVDRLNQLKTQEQECLQELLRLDGEVRLLQRLSKDGETKPE